MKLLIAIIALSLSASTYASLCSVDNVDFKPAKIQVGQEYQTLEVGVYKDITFYYMSGHGVVRMEAYVNKKLVAATYSREDFEREVVLSLEVLSNTGKLADASCYIPQEE